MIEEPDRTTLIAMWGAYRDTVLAPLPRPFTDIEWAILETTFYAAAQSVLRCLREQPALFVALHNEAESAGKRIQRRLM